MATSRSASSAAVNAASSTSGSRDWPNEIVAVLRMPPHSTHGGSGSRRASTSRRRPSPAARHAGHLPDRPVELEDASRSSALVQAVDVLGHHGAPGDRIVGARPGRGVHGSAQRSRRGSRGGWPTPAGGPPGRACTCRCRTSPARRGGGTTTCGPRKSLIPESVEMPAPVRTTTSGESTSSSTSSLCVPMGAMMAHRTAGAR